MSQKRSKSQKSRRQNANAKSASTEARPRQPSNRAGMLRYGRMFLELASIALNFWLGYLVMRPGMAVEYNAAIVPPNSFALPFKVTNYGALPVRNIVCMVTENADAASSITMRNNQTVLPLARDLASGKTIEEVYSMVNCVYQPLSGFTEIDLWYQLPLFGKIYHETEVFEIYRNGDGTTRWLVKTSNYARAPGK